MRERLTPSHQSPDKEPQLDFFKDPEGKDKIYDGQTDQYVTEQEAHRLRVERAHKDRDEIINKYEEEEEEEVSTIIVTKENAFNYQGRFNTTRSKLKELRKLYKDLSRHPEEGSSYSTIEDKVFKIFGDWNDALNEVGLTIVPHISLRQIKPNQLIVIAPNVFNIPNAELYDVTYKVHEINIVENNIQAIRINGGRESLVSLTEKDFLVIGEIN